MDQSVPLPSPPERGEALEGGRPLWDRGEGGETTVGVAGMELPPLEGGRPLWDRGEGVNPRSVWPVWSYHL